MLAEELKPRLDLLFQLVIDDARDEHAAGLGQGLQPVGDDDPFAVHVDGPAGFPLDDDIAEIDADTAFDALVCRYCRVTLGHAALNRHRTFDRIHHAREFGQEAVAHELEDMAVMLGDPGLEQFPAMGAQTRERASLVALHEPAVADNISSKNGG